MKDERNLINFGSQVIITEPFLRAWRYLPSQVKRIAKTKIDLLASNPSHPSLNVHRIRRSGGRIWVCYISYTCRLLYQYKDGTLWLHELGRHDVVDKCHHRSYSR